MIELAGWLFVVLTFIGYILNIKKNKWCFVLWVVCSIWWISTSLMREQYSLVGNFSIYLIAEIWGFVQWNKEEKWKP